MAPRGLRRLADLCLKLANRCESINTAHLHLEDYDLLTNASLRGTVGLFPEE